MPAYTKTLALAAAAILYGAPAFAQQEVGAGRVELGIATGGGALFLQSEGGGSELGQFAVGVTFTFNFGPRLGIEGDVGFAGARAKDVSIGGTVVRQTAPTIFNHNGTLIFNVIGRDRRIFPYLAAGVGGLTTLHAVDTAGVGETTTRTFPAVNVGGGVNWFPFTHIGIRGDYRFLLLHNADNAPVLLGDGALRSVHRIYAALILTY